MTEPVVTSEKIHQGRVIGLRVDTVLINGKEHPREIVEHPGAIVAVPIDGEGRVHLVRQYRHAVGKVVLELPAGTLKPGENPDDCVARELAEEIGQQAARIEKIGGFYAAPGYSTEYLHCYLARDLSPCAGEQDEDEAIDVDPIPLGKVRQMVATGEIDDAKTLAGLALAFPHL